MTRLSALLMCALFASGTAQAEGQTSPNEDLILTAQVYTLVNKTLEAKAVTTKDPESGKSYSTYTRSFAVLENSPCATATAEFRPKRDRLYLRARCTMPFDFAGTDVDETAQMEFEININTNELVAASIYDPSGKQMPQFLDRKKVLPRLNTVISVDILSNIENWD